MFTDWTHWLSWLHPNELLIFVWALLLVDSPRYAFSKIMLCLWDMGQSVRRRLRGIPAAPSYTHCPSVCAVVAAYNEEETIAATLQSIWGTYPRLEMLVIDDGSSDATGSVVRAFAESHAGVQVLRREERGGKASAVNFALAYARAEVVVIVDADSHLAPSAIWEIVQPLQDPEVGAVSATVLVRNPFDSLATWFQAYEYVQTIFIGRMVSSALGILSIVSGAFGAFRRTVLEQGKGYDVGPDEDTDLTLFVRKTGTKIAFAPYAQCFTNVPATWRQLFRQRRRWDLGEIVRCYCRKHIDLAYFWGANFRFRNLGCILDTWLFRILFQAGIWAWIIWFFLHPPAHWDMILLTLYLGYTVFEVSQALAVFYFTQDLRRDALICAVVPLVIIYQAFLFLVRTLAILEEIFFRSSFDEEYVPAHVRQATWHW